MWNPFKNISSGIGHSNQAQGNSTSQASVEAYNQMLQQQSQQNYLAQQQLNGIYQYNATYIVPKREIHIFSEEYKAKYRELYDKVIELNKELDTLVPKNVYACDQLYIEIGIRPSSSMSEQDKQLVQLQTYFGISGAQHTTLFGSPSGK